MLIGVLALQGAVREHIAAVERCGAEARPVKTVQAMDGIDGLIMPGGESTTIWKLMGKYGLDAALAEAAAAGLPIFGTCCGMILLAERVVAEETKLGLIDLTVQRNAYGRQLDSFEAPLSLKWEPNRPFTGVFIRAPRVEAVGLGVEVLAEHEGSVVLARRGGILVSSFHPELTDDERVHRYFIEEMSRR